MLDWQHANTLALNHVQAWIPGGELQGDEYVVRNPTRGDKHAGSFKINLKIGKWIENVTGEGGDLVSLRAYLDGSEQGEAFNWIIDAYDPTYFAPIQDARRDNKNPGDYWRDFRYCHKGHKNEPELKTEHHQKKYGREIERWPLKIKVGQTWRVVSWIVRFQSDKKQDLPYTLWSDGQTQKWRMKAPEGKYPLYGLEALENKPNAKVSLTEGQKKASRAEKILPEWACVGWYGGALNIEKSDLEPLRGREVWFPFDADAPGRAVLKILRELDVKVHPVYPPVDSPKGWDIADAIAEGWSKERLEAWLLADNQIAPVQAKGLVPAREWEVQDYLESATLHRVFLSERCGEDNFFVHNEMGYLWNKTKHHWVPYPVACIIEEFQQWALSDNSELMKLAQSVNSMTVKAGEKVYPETIMSKSISMLKRYRGPNTRIEENNPFSGIEGAKPYWHFPNGMLEISAKGLTWYPREENQESFFRETFPLSCMGFEYDPEAKEAPYFLSTINRLLPEGQKNEAGLKFILQCFAYSLMPKKMKPYYFICHGFQGSGKSSLAEVLFELCGSYFIYKGAREIFSRFGLPGLVGKLVVCDDDVSDDFVLPTEIKKMSANKKTTIEEKGVPQYDALLNVAPWIIGNRPPRTTGSDGHDRRAVVMHFVNTEPGDPLHMEKMFGRLEGYKDERPAILNMVLEVLPEFTKTWEFDRPAWANENHKAWIENSNSVASYFSEFREADADTWYPRTLVHLHYTKWCELTGTKPLAAAQFYASLAGERIESKTLKGVRLICCPFELPELDREELKIMKQGGYSRQEGGVRKYEDRLPF